ncbi:protein of unknown function [Limnospira indica PCC 8005]|uniref:Uncharacterized protein n=1 Tax=Limnospira indica PCC 8005 TaxID=376219 RepID=A0A9P1NWV8_9CYAN|nr:protein of unknown function [Limnospira indica PCC 8005]
MAFHCLDFPWYPWQLGFDYSLLLNLAAPLINAYFSAIALSPVATFRTATHKTIIMFPL